MSTPSRSLRPRVWALIAVGVAAGLLSGFFGVGGGVIVVPALLLLGCDQRIATGTSTAAILPTAVVGTVGYALAGDIAWIPGIALSVGVVAGAQLGTLLLARLSRDLLFWLFLFFVAAAAASLWLSVPQRAHGIEVTWGSILALVLLGAVVGVMSGVLGVGGGIIAVPALMLLFGAGDLVARGTSLLMMVPGSVSATIGNVRRGNVDLVMAAWIGVAACAFSPLGIVAANLVDPFWGNIAFAVLMTFVIANLVIKRIRQMRDSPAHRS